MKTKSPLATFFILSFIHYIAANLAHPITPTLIVQLELHDYMFGAAFAAMAFTNFLFSPFWGKMRGFFSAKKLLLLGSIGYGIGQFLFGISKKEITILLARCIAGFFIGAIAVSTLIYVTEMSEENKIGDNLAKLVIIQALGSASGFLVGGVLGLYSIKITFILQSISLILIGILFFFLLFHNELDSKESWNKRQFFHEINPIKSFLDAKTFMTKSLMILFTIVVLANIGTNSFEQCFNYYLKDRLHFSSVYNGIFKAMTGIITLIVNSTVCLHLLRKKELRIPIAWILAGCSISAMSVLMSNQPSIFLSLCMVFFSFNAIYIPLLQRCIDKNSGEITRNLIMGFYNATRSLGMICGALLAGFIYKIQPKLPLALASICFALSWFILYYDLKKSIKKTD